MLVLHVCGMGIGVKTKNIRYNVLIIVFAVLFAGSAGAMIWRVWQYHQASALYQDLAAQVVQDNPAYTVSPSGKKNARKERTQSKSAPIRVDFKKLSGQYPQIAGWLYCEGTTINYPVMQGRDNSYYLHHTPGGSYQFSGSLFVSCNNTMPFTDDNTIIYGHNMKNGSMFGELANYRADRSYYRKHGVWYFLTPQKNYKLTILAGCMVETDSDVYRTDWGGEEELVRYLNLLQSRSEFQVEAPEQISHLATLSTCTSRSEKSRFVLVADVIPLAD